MTPQERAVKIVSDLLQHNNWTIPPYSWIGYLTEEIRVAIVEATNDELEKRRAAEAIVIRQDALAGSHTRELLQSANATLEEAKAALETQKSKLDTALLALDTVQSMAKEIYWVTSTDPRKVQVDAKAIIDACVAVLVPSEPNGRQPTLVEGEDETPYWLNPGLGDMAHRVSDELRAMGLFYSPEQVRKRFLELMGGDYKPAEPHVWHDRTKSKEEPQSAQCFCWPCRNHRGEVGAPSGPIIRDIPATVSFEHTETGYCYCWTCRKGRGETN